MEIIEIEEPGTDLSLHLVVSSLNRWVFKVDWDDVDDVITMMKEDPHFCKSGGNWFWLPTDNFLLHWSSSEHLGSQRRL